MNFMYKSNHYIKNLKYQIIYEELVKAKNQRANNLRPDLHVGSDEVHLGFNRVGLLKGFGSVLVGSLVLLSITFANSRIL